MSVRQSIVFAALAAIWGASYLLIKYALEDFSPACVVCARLFVAAIVLAAAMALSSGLGSVRNALRDIRRRPAAGALLALTTLALPFMLITIAEITVNSGMAAILIAPMPMFVAIFAIFVDASERISRSQVFGLVVGIVGIGLVVGVDAVQSLGEFIGAMGILLAAALYSVGGMVTKKRYGGLSPTEGTFIAASLAAIMTLPFVFTSLPSHVPHIRSVVAVVALGAFMTALAFVLYFKLIPEIGAGRASLVSYLSPGIAVIYGAILLSEEITVAAVIGLVLILSGTFTASRGNYRSNASRARPLPDELDDRLAGLETTVTSGEEDSLGQLEREQVSRRFARTSPNPQAEERDESAQAEGSVD